jgi:hypothetical protein
MIRPRNNIACLAAHPIIYMLTTEAVMYFGIAVRATALDFRFNDNLFRALHIHDPIWRLEPRS